MNIKFNIKKNSLKKNYKSQKIKILQANLGILKQNKKKFTS